MNEDDDDPRWRDNPYRPKDATLSDIRNAIEGMKYELNKQLHKLNSQVSVLMLGMAFMFITALGRVDGFSQV